MSEALLAELYTIRQTAQVLQLGRDTTYALVRAGVIPSIRIGKQIRVPRGNLERWIAEAKGKYQTD
jgi:excisionase family DNA binding protein